MKVRYDLAHDVASHDHHSWLCIAAAQGATEVVFAVDNPKETKWTKEVVLRRFETMLWPAPDFLGLRKSIGIGGQRTRHQPHLRELVKWCRGNDIPRMRSVLPPKSVRYTITLRNDKRIPTRNSNDAAWWQFASELGGEVKVFQDWEDEPISEHERMAYYAGAEMNFGILSGPFWLAQLSEYPWMMFDCANPAGSLKDHFPHHGVPVGSQLPWSRPHQRIVWEPETIEVLRKHFAAWKASR